MVEKFKYQGGGSRAMGDLMDRVASGDTPICFKCGAELIVAINLDQITKHKVHPGIYCPNHHIRQMIEIAWPDREAFWKQFEKSED